MRFIDTHCHIDLDVFDGDRAAVIDRARLAGVRDMLVIGFEPTRWRAALSLASTYPDVRVAAGLHPNSVQGFSEDLLRDIEAQSMHDQVVAIGETGIDLYWDAATLEQQKRAFRAQIDLAQNVGLPFIVHQRDAENEVLEVLRTFGGSLNGVLHCFTGDWHYAQSLLQLGMDIGLGGAITFKSRTDLHDAASRIPLERIVLETDSPFMAPAPFRGKRNEPSYVVSVAERLAHLKGQDVETIAGVTSENAMRRFPGLGARNLQS